MDLLDGSFGPKAGREATGTYSLHVSGKAKRLFSFARETIASDNKILPLTPFEPEVRTLADSFAKVGELLPLLLYAHQEGSSRTVAALWLGQDGQHARAC